MNGDAYAPESGSHPLPPAYTQQPVQPSPAPDEHFQLPFFPAHIATERAADLPGHAVSAHADVGPEDLPAPEDFAYEADEAAEPASIPADAFFFPEEAADEATPVDEPAAPGAADAGAWVPQPAEEQAPTEPWASQPAAEEAPPEPWPAEPAVEQVPPEPWASEPAMEQVPPEPWASEPAVEQVPPEPWAAEPAVEQVPPEPWAAEPVAEPVGAGAPAGEAEAGLDDATHEVAGRLEALALALRQQGAQAARPDLAGDSLDTALAALVSGYLAGRAR